MASDQNNPVVSNPAPSERWFSQGNEAFSSYFKKINLNLRYWWWGSVVALVAGAVGGGLVAYHRRPHLGSPIQISASLAGLVVGALIAGLAIMAKSYDSEFLKSLDRVNGGPVSQYFSPFITTATIGILAILSILAYTIIPVDFAAVWRTVVGAFAGGLTLLTLSGLAGAFGTLIQFIDIYEDHVLGRI